jgi:hypothetical protein
MACLQLCEWIERGKHDAKNDHDAILGLPNASHASDAHTHTQHTPHARKHTGRRRRRRCMDCAQSFGRTKEAGWWRPGYTGETGGGNVATLDHGGGAAAGWTVKTAKNSKAAPRRAHNEHPPTTLARGLPYDMERRSGEIQQRSLLVL